MDGGAARMVRDEFIYDIRPETQSYVRRILGTAEDYRGSTRSRATRPQVTPKPVIVPRKK